MILWEKNMMLFKQQQKTGRALKEHRVPLTVEPFTTIELTFDLIGLGSLRLVVLMVQKSQGQPPGNGSKPYT